MFQVKDLNISSRNLNQTLEKKMIEDIIEEIFPWIFDIFFKYKITSIGALLIILGVILKILNYNFNWLIYLGIALVIIGFFIKK